MVKMKNSGIEWIGEIPEDWKISKVKYEVSESLKYGASEPGVDYNENLPRYIRITDIDSDGNLKDEGKLSLTETQAKGYILKDETILFARSGGTVGKTFFYNSIYGKAAFAGYLISAVPNPKKMNPHWFYLYTKSNAYWDWAKRVFTQATIQNIGADKYGEMYIPLPPIETQKRIADFLDSKCSKIDSLKNDIAKQIETLEQYKKSVITEAVTKGINPDVKMKDSGVEWIGNVPETWIVDNPKYHFTQRKDRAKFGLKQLTASQKYGVITQEEYMEKTGAKVVLVEKDFEILKLVCPGDFVIHMRSFQGGLEYSENYGSISSAYVMLIPQKTIAEPRFYKWFFKSPVYIDALSSTSNLIRDGQAMRYANFIQLPIPIPPAEEQKEIADYLDSKCSSIDNIINSKKQQLEKLEEYKKSLIFEYVTGKREV